MAAFIVAGFITCYLMRVCVNLALNEMTFKQKVTDAKDKKQHYCPPGTRTNETYSRAEFHWDQHLQHDIIESTYIGYILAHVPAGVLADMFGGKHVFGAGILLSSTMSLCSPFLARLSPYALMAGRVLLGFGQGVMFPSSSSLVAKWSPANERSTMTGIVQSGVMLGNAAGYMVSGYMLSLFSGWEPIFYLVGVIGLLWWVAWQLFCYSSPDDHPFITEKERDLIQTQMSQSPETKPKLIPWKRILTSAPFWSAMSINFSHDWALFTIVNETPTYMGKVLNFDVKHSGIYSALPHIAMFPAAIGSGYLCDWLSKKKFISITANRKAFSFLANVMPIPFMLGASYSGCNHIYVVIFLMCMMFWKGMVYSSVRANPVDLSPNYAGVLMGLLNGTGSIAGLLSPMFVPHIITGDGSIEEWRKVFYLAAFIMVAFSIPYLFWGSGEVQPWNVPETLHRDSVDVLPKPNEYEETKT